MEGVTIGAWAAGVVAGLGLALYIRKTHKDPDPEEKLKELIGTQGIAQRDRNRAERDEKGKTGHGL
jgi:hypothetical protein